MKDKKYNFDDLIYKKICSEKCIDSLNQEISCSECERLIYEGISLGLNWVLEQGDKSQWINDLALPDIIEEALDEINN